MDIAVDAVAQIFIPDNDGNNSSLVNSFQSWEPEIKTEADLSYFLYSVVTKKTEYQISLTLRESDSIFSKILNTLKYEIKKNNLQRVNYFGETYIAPEGCMKINFPAADENVIAELPAKFIVNYDFENIFRYFENRGYPKALHLNKFILHLKQIIFSEMKYLSNDNELNKNSFAEEFELSATFEKVLELIRIKICKNYVQKDKITQAEASSILKAFSEISRDMQTGISIWGLYDYLKEQIPSLTKESYKEQYQNMFEYLYKEMKNLLVDEIEI